MARSWAEGKIYSFYSSNYFISTRSKVYNSCDDDDNDNGKPVLVNLRT